MIACIRYSYILMNEKTLKDANLMFGGLTSYIIKPMDNKSLTIVRDLLSIGDI